MENQKSTYEFSANFWDHKKVGLKKQYPFLTDTDLKLEPGNLGELMNNLSVKLGKTDQQLREFIIKL